MSLINDALKKARQAPPGNTPTSQPPLQPPGAESSAAAWLIPAVVIFLIVAAIFFIGWAAAHNTVRTIEATPSPVDTQQPSTFVVPVTPPPPPDPAPILAPVVKPVLPQLQGIFYSATAPTAILDGKTVSPGDQFKEYRVKTISKDTVTLIGPDKQEVRLSMEN